MSKITYTLKEDTEKNIHLRYAQELNDEQLQVVTQADGPCLVLAGAGSGKTRTLVYRVAYLLENKIPAEQILLMTFTNKAAKEMLWRVESLLGFKPKHLWGGTFHHIGNLILRKYIKKIGFNNNYSILDEEDARDLITAIIGGTNYKKNKYFPKASVIKNIISFANNSQKNIKQVFTEKFSYLEQSILPQIEEIASLYKERKKQHNALDYDDLLLHWLKLLETHEEVRKTLSNKFNYILVDEYQDTNRLQAKIIELLSSDHQNILVVGDDAQSIYSFRAADVSNILSFPKKFDKVKIFKLETNYRSCPEILTLANNSISHNVAQFPKVLKPIRPSGQKPIIIPVQNNEQQAQFISQRILELTEEGFALRDIAILFRADYQALELELELNKKSIPYIKRGGIKFFEQAHLKDIASFLKIISNPNDEIAWTRILNLQAGIGRVGAQKIISLLPKNTFTTAVHAKLTELPKQLQTAWENFRKILVNLEQIKNNDLSSLIQIIMKNFYELYLQTNYDNANKRIEDVEQLENFATTYDSLENFLSDISLSENFRTDDSQTADKNEDYLLLSTIHQAKGLEWPVVFVIHLINGQFPHAKAMEKNEEIEEERRLFYVAITRAKDILYLVYPHILYNQQYGFIFGQPSDFIQELNANLYDTWEIESTSDNPTSADLPTIEYN
jgi:DNA helicase-2/ATP-dependent DNA helicase PcrA